MKIKIFMLFFILFFGVNSYAKVKREYSAFYNYSESNIWKNYSFGLDVNYKDKNKYSQESCFIRLKQSHNGSLVAINSEYKEDLNSNWDYWSGLSYINDTIVGIDGELDFKVGFGYYLLREKRRYFSNQIKFSYGLILRDLHLLHSLRLKNKFRSFLLSYDFMVNYIMPNGLKNFERLDIEFTPYTKIHGLKPAISYDYVKTHYNSLFEIKFKLGGEF